MSLLLRLALSCLVAAAMATGAHAERRIALVIGNSAYSGVSPLANPKNDAELMAKTLQSVGFEVTKIVDADQRAMKQAMLDFGRKLRDGADASLFYYSGHGVQAKGENYLIPVDAAIKDEGELDLQAIDVNAFLQVMDNAASKVNIVILDACRNNPFASSSRSATRGLAMVGAPRGTYIAYSTGIDQVAEDGTGANSPYTEALAKAIVKPGIKLEDAFKDARRLVEAATDNKQVPWETTSITGDFYFRPPAPPASDPGASAETRPVAPPPSAGIAADEAAWRRIAASTDPADFGRFLQAFPASPHAAAARARQASLAKASETASAETKPVAPVPDSDIAADHVAWLRIANSTDATDFDRFLQAFPSSRFARAAKARQASLATDQQKQIAVVPKAGENPAAQNGVFVLLSEWRTQAIALDKFREEQRRFPRLLGDKQPNLKQEPLSQGGIAFRIRVGPFPDMEKAGNFCGLLKGAGGFCLVPASAQSDTPASPASTVHSMGKIEVPPTYVFNLDAGGVAPDGHDGVWFEASTANDLYLVPINGAELAAGDLSQRDFKACAAETYATSRISLRELPVGSFICVKTNAGRIARIRINALSPVSPRTLALNYVVWQ